MPGRPGTRPRTNVGSEVVVPPLPTRNQREAVLLFHRRTGAAYDGEPEWRFAEVPTNHPPRAREPGRLAGRRAES